MPPIDPSPHAGEAMHPPEQPRFPQPKTGQQSDADQPAAPGDVQPATPSRPRETGPDVVSGGEDPILGSGDDIAG